MEITILGSGTAIPDKDRGSPGLAVSVGKSLLLLDIGAGSLYRSARFGVPVEMVDFVLLTHLHPDHTGDLLSLLFAFRNPEYYREKALSILGPQGLQDFFRGLQGVYGDWIDAIGYEQNIITPDSSETLAYKGFCLKTCSVQHGPPALAYEITDNEGRRMVYSGDTEYCEALVRLAAKADLLILECSFPDGQACAGHLTPSLAGRIADEAGCKRLLLTHFYPACQGQDLLTPCRRLYKGPITMAEDGMRLSL